MSEDTTHTVDVRLLNQTIAVLDDETRRAICYALVDADHVHVPTIGCAIADGGVDANALELRHQHLPKLAATRLVTWDRERDELHPTPTFERVRPLVEFLQAYERADRD